MAYMPRHDERRVDEGHFITTRTALASVRACKYCKHFEIYRYTGGHRGAGMVGGNKARGRIIQHLKTDHPDKYPGQKVTK